MDGAVLLIDRVAAGLAPVLGRLDAASEPQRQAAVKGVATAARLTLAAVRRFAPLVWDQAPPEAVEQYASWWIVLALGRATAQAGLDGAFADELLAAARGELPAEASTTAAAESIEPEPDEVSEDLESTEPAERPGWRTLIEAEAEGSYHDALAAWIEAKAPEFTGLDFGPGGAAEAADMAVGLMAAGVEPGEAISQAIASLAPGVADRLERQEALEREIFNGGRD